MSIEKWNKIDDRVSDTARDAPESLQKKSVLSFPLVPGENAFKHTSSFLSSLKRHIETVQVG